ncbi:hypothetical protein [Azospirillum sp. SYSU D00513]|uniref:hypothetical protein n=1 Tax=Azospirillum sp. SYSU D00513 TaxID=2812561 RepID=UPI001A97C218|nr:hypothetical protein [Azospirillum sp. SYSU D00513]
MLKEALFNIIQQEQREVEDELRKEQHSPSPDQSRLGTLRREATDLSRELEHFRDV